MPHIKDTIAHVKLHVEAEMNDSDPSQFPGVRRRGQFILNALKRLERRSETVSSRQFLDLLDKELDGGVDNKSAKRLLSGNHEKPQLAIQSWVGKGKEE